MDMYDFKNMLFSLFFLQVLNILFKGSFCSKGFLVNFSW